MAIDIILQNPNHFKDIPAENEITQWITHAWQNHHLDEHRTIEMVVRIVEKDEIQQLNRQYRGKDSATNVLSFPYTEDLIHIQGLPDQEQCYVGDMVICQPVLQDEAQQQNKSLHQHWAHMTIHSTLHLQGYDHIDRDDAEIMETLEKEIMHNLGFSDPYQDDEQ